MAQHSTSTNSTTNTSKSTTTNNTLSKPSGPPPPQTPLPVRPLALPRPPNPFIPPATPQTCSPPLHHFTNLLHSISLSESALSALRVHLLSEMALLNTYFINAERRIKEELTPAIRGKSSFGIEFGVRVTEHEKERSIRVKAAEERRQKWAEMEAMREYESGVKRVWENLLRREEVERSLREKLGECAELLLMREGLGRELVGE